MTIFHHDLSSLQHRNGAALSHQQFDCSQWTPATVLLKINDYVCVYWKCQNVYNVPQYWEFLGDCTELKGPKWIGKPLKKIKHHPGSHKFHPGKEHLNYFEPEALCHPTLSYPPMQFARSSAAPRLTVMESCLREHGLARWAVPRLQGCQKTIKSSAVILIPRHRVLALLRPLALTH